ncbi:multiple epidermal growth factor-like domains protein 10 [Ostrea edulis]|uniref:multiple epidermal growth factor-like domains protein 10 n=1 Tax=Ostrea edulis TaxID=37623 RepID=UPI0024AFC195|nr:multiple epidermal growth factor-like domains protein 10 [Ostrea edulis]
MYICTMKGENILIIMLLMSVILSVFVQIAISCNASGYVPCCEGYMLNTTSGDCTKCSVGFIGYQCKQPCPFPSFGEGCQSVCKCSQNLCSVSTGCQEPSGNVTAEPSTKISNENISINGTAEFIAIGNSVVHGGSDVIIFTSSLLTVVVLGILVYGGYKRRRNRIDRECNHAYQSTGRFVDDCEIKHTYAAIEMGLIS